MKHFSRFRNSSSGFLILLGLSATLNLTGEPLASRLAQTPFKLVHESYLNNNWELIVCNADGSHPQNLTQTPDVHELYPQVSPDGSKVCFVSDSGSGRDTVRSIYVMNMDGTDRRLVASPARQPCWSPDSQTIVFLPQEYPKFNIVDYYTKGIRFYHLPTGTTRDHPNNKAIHHLYNINYAPNGKWLIATVHAGMGHGHANLLVEAKGDKIIDLGIDGCRPTISPDGKQVAWGPGDHEIAVADLDLDSDEPKIGPKKIRITDEKLKIYHVDWSPDGQFLSISRGPNGQGDPTKPGTHQAACEMVGVHALGWNLIAVSTTRLGHLDLERANENEWAPITTNGASNKESDWYLPKQP